MANYTYIHIPFCKQKCKYCSFISYPCLEKIEEYFIALEKEIDLRYSGEKLKTLYFGGGTPSLIQTKYFEKLINKFNFDLDPEITIELNPDDVNLKYLLELKKIGINRLSIGAQTFNDKVLNLIGRRHSSRQTVEAVNLAKKAEFKNISLDLIYGLPDSNLKSDLEEILKLDIQHISAYGLKIEEESYFGKHIPNNLPDEDIQADMYILINETLEKNGFNRYEISNFAKEGYESKHNLNYWNNNEYYGFGISAHGYLNGVRYSNYTKFEDYFKTPQCRESEHIQTKSEILEEEIFLGFRKEAGINTKHINKNFDIDFNEKYKKILERFTPEFIEKTEYGYKLTIKGILLSNHILSEFIL